MAHVQTATPLLRVEHLSKQYQRGWPRKVTTFSLEADFEIEGPSVIGVMGANGAANRSCQSGREIR